MSPSAKVLEEAVKWWVAHRPKDWSQQDHIESPLVGIDESEWDLALAVADTISEREEETRR